MGFFAFFHLGVLRSPAFLPNLIRHCMSKRRTYRMNFKFNDFQGSVLQKEKRKSIRSMLQICFSVYLFVFFVSSSQECMNQVEKYHIYSTIVESMKNV